MKIILSTTSKQELADGLTRQKDFNSIYTYIMSLDYFCFISISNKKELSRLTKELYIYYANFSKTLNIIVLHNSSFYETQSINKLNYWDYFRNIVSLNSQKELQYTDAPTLEKCKSIVQRIEANNFNKKPEICFSL